MKRIYADAAATTVINFDAMIEMINTMNMIPGNPSSSYAEGREAKEKLENCRERCAKCLDCEPNEIIFTSGATEGNETIRNLSKTYISSNIEHPSALAKENTNLMYADSNGLVYLPSRLQVFPKDSVVSLMMANNEIGTIQFVRQTVDVSVCQRLGSTKRIFFHTDATAAVGHIPVSFRELGVDFLTCSAHKFHGPRGVGILIVRNGTEFTPLLTGGKQERGMRAGTENLPGIAGMTVALEYATTHLYENAEKVSKMRDKLMEGCLSIPGSYLNGDAVSRLPGNVNVSFDGIEGESLLTLLDAKGIAASAGSACHTGTSEPSHVLLAIGRTREQALSALRLTIDETNTDEEIEYIIKAVRESVEYLRKFTLNQTK